MKRNGFILAAMLCAIMPAHQAIAAVIIPLTVNLSEAVTVTGNPQIAVDVGGTTRYAVYSSGSGTTALTFTLSPQPGDVDLDGIAISSPIQLNGGTLKDAAGNDASLTFTPPDTSGIKIDYPSLGMNFIYDADGRYTLNGTAYNDLLSFLSATGGSFTRASIGTYYDSTGTLQIAAPGVPRFDYDPVTHAAKGLLIEESRTNLFTNSEFLNGVSDAPTRGGLVSSNAFSGLTGNKGIYFGYDGTTDSYAYKNATMSGTYTFSVFVRMSDGLAPFFSGGTYSSLNDFIIVICGNTTPVSSYTVADMGGGLYRVSFVKTGAVTSNHNGIVKYHQNSSRTFTVSGFQIEQGAFPTSYIPTTSASVTRSTDDLSVPVNSTWNGSLSGTTKAAFYLPNLAAASGMTIFSLYTGSNNGYLLYKGTGTATLSAYANATSIIIGTLSPTASAKAAISYDTLSAYTTFNSSSVLPYSNATVSTSTTLLFGKTWFGNQMTGYLETFNYYPTRVADRQLQLLTQ